MGTYTKTTLQAQRPTRLHPQPHPPSSSAPPTFILSPTHLHSQPPPELQVGPLKEVLLTDRGVLPLARHRDGQGGEDGVLDEAARQLVPQSQLVLAGVEVRGEDTVRVHTHVATSAGQLLYSQGNNDRSFYSKNVHFCSTDEVG